MLRGIFGKTGGGKTYTLVSKIIETLLYSERTVVTNLTELELENLAQYLHDRQHAEKLKHPARVIYPIDLNTRLIIIQKPDTREFYRYRSGGLVLPKFTGIDPATRKKYHVDDIDRALEIYFGEIYKNPKHAKGVDYFLTECHRHFKARDTLSFSSVLNFWATQNRHFDDNGWIESQFAAQIDMNLRELCVEWYHFRNYGNEVSGMFKNRAVIEWRMYYSLPKSERDPSFDKGQFKLDIKGICTCYKTRGAVASGMVDNSPDTKPKNKKLPFWLLPVGVVLAIFLVGGVIAILPFVAQKGLTSLTSGFTGATKTALSPGATPAGALSAPQPKPVEDNQPARVSLPPPPKPERSVSQSSESGLKPTGWVKSGRVLIVTLSDGSRRWFSRDHLALSDPIRAVTPSYVDFNGERLYFVNEPRPFSPALSAPAFSAPVQSLPAPSVEPPPASTSAPSGIQTRMEGNPFRPSGW